MIIQVIDSQLIDYVFSDTLQPLWIYLKSYLNGQKICRCLKNDSLNCKGKQDQVLILSY